MFDTKKKGSEGFGSVWGHLTNQRRYLSLFALFFDEYYLKHFIIIRAYPLIKRIQCCDQMFQNSAIQGLRVLDLRDGWVSRINLHLPGLGDMIHCQQTRNPKLQAPATISPAAICSVATLTLWVFHTGLGNANELLSWPTWSVNRDYISSLCRCRSIPILTGYLTATATDYLTLMMDICDGASASEANAKAVVGALISEFKYCNHFIRLWTFSHYPFRYGAPPAQLSAAIVRTSTSFLLLWFLCIVMGYYVTEFVRNLYISVHISEIPRYPWRTSFFSKNLFSSSWACSPGGSGCSICKWK